MSIRRKVEGWEVENFSSTIDYAESMKDRMHQNNDYFHENQRAGINNPKWAGCNTYEEAMDFFLNGWKSKTYNQTLKKVQEINTLKTKPSRERYNDVMGFQPIVPNALKGVPTSMINERITQKKAKVIDIAISLEVPARIEAKKVLEKLDEVILKVAEIEKQGFRANITFFSAFSGSDGKNGDFMSIKIKDARQPININKIMFLLGHPSMLRIVGFDWCERTPGLIGLPSYGYPLYTIEKMSQQEKRQLISNLVGVKEETTYIVTFDTDIEEEFSKLR